MPTKITKKKFKDISKAIEYLSSLGLKSVHDVFWFKPDSHDWAFLSKTEKSIAFFRNTLVKGNPKSVAIAAPPMKRKKKVIA